MTKRLIVLALVAAILAPGVASAGGSTDAALGLAAFAVFNQLFGGVGYFQPAPPPPQVVVVAPPPPPPVTVYEYHYPVPQVYQYYAVPYQYYPAPPAWYPNGRYYSGHHSHRHHYDEDGDD